MPDLQSIIQTLTEQDSLAFLRLQADKLLQGAAPDDSIALAHQLYESESYQARMVAAIILGRLADQHDGALQFLRTTVSRDTDWRVQEVLAMAFDTYCKNVGYEQALPIIKSWINDPHPNSRRAASEGLRIWTSRDYFKQHPDVAIELLGSLKNDDSAYVRKSAGNALRDISRKYKTFVATELETWDLSSKAIADTYKYAAKFIVAESKS